MSPQAYEINGQVIHAHSGRGIAHLRVEAWDKDARYNDLLGNASTDGEGRFNIFFDSTYFREFSPDTAPELFFKVFMGGKLLKSTENELVKNAAAMLQVVIKIDMPAERAAGKDRISAVQVLKAADFFQQSDFKGVYREFRSKAGTSLGLVADIVMKTVTNLDIKPVQVRGNKVDDVVGQDVANARQKLHASNIQVAEVRPYNPKLNTAALQDITALSLSGLKEGQQVNLYEENGTVKYYAVVKEKQAVRSTEEATANNEQFSKMQTDLTAAIQSTAQKEEQLQKLALEMEALRKEHAEIKSLLQSDALVQLLQTMQKETGGKGRTNPGPKGPAK